MVATFLALVPSMIASGFAFAAFAFAGVLVARLYYAGSPLPGSPPPAEPPLVTLIVGAALLGGVCAYRGIPMQTIVVIAVLCGIMAAIWATDVTRGFIPDALTLIPLGAVLLSGMLGGRWSVLIAAAGVSAPFAFMAWRTKGFGMGWGDVKLAALGGAVLGLQDAMLAFALAAFVAVAVAKIRHTEKQPMAFAPYMAASIVIPLCLHTTVR